MKIYNYSEARQKFTLVLNTALKEEVIIKRQDGSMFQIVPLQGNQLTSPLDVKGINSDITTADIIDFVRESREV